jgi:hypothetical protein
MQSVVGIFASRTRAEQAVRGLMATPIAPQSITLLTGEAGRARWAASPLPTPSAMVWVKQWVDW